MIWSKKRIFRSDQRIFIFMALILVEFLENIFYHPVNEQVHIKEHFCFFFKIGGRNLKI